MEFRLLTREEYIRDNISGGGIWYTMYYPQVKQWFIWWDLGVEYTEKEALTTIENYRNCTANKPYVLYKTNKDLM